MAHIQLKNFHADFPVYNAHSRSLKKNALKFLTGGQVANSDKGVVIRALDDLSFILSDGDRVALLGHNGAGKSTLLRVLSGVYAPTAGSIEIVGKVGSLIDIGLGIDPEATGRQNIYIRGTLLGLSRKEVNRQVDEIIQFSELGEFINLPARTYSTGMMLRLAFAASIIMQPEILIMDEWLSVGDRDFNQKANEKLTEVIRKSQILVMATHSKESALKNCNKAIWLEHGRIKMMGSMQEIADIYWS